MGAFDSIFNTTRKIVNDGKQSVQASDFILNPLLKTKPKAPVFGLPKPQEPATPSLTVASPSRQLVTPTTPKIPMPVQQPGLQSVIPINPLDIIRQGKDQVIRQATAQEAIPEDKSNPLTDALFGNVKDKAVLRDMQRRGINPGFFSTWGTEGFWSIMGRDKEEQKERLYYDLVEKGIEPNRATEISFNAIEKNGGLMAIAQDLESGGKGKRERAIKRLEELNLTPQEKVAIGLQRAGQIAGTALEATDVLTFGTTKPVKAAISKRVQKIAANMTAEDADILRNMYRELPAGSVSKNIDAEDRIVKAMGLDKVPDMERRQAVEEILTAYDIRWQGVEEMVNPPGQAPLQRAGAMDIKKPVKDKVRVRGSNEVLGVAAGVQQDEDGNVEFNPMTAALGVLGIGAVGSLKRVSKFKKGTSEAFQQADYEVTTQLAELSQAGKRVMMDSGEVRAWSSTFPDWVPEHLRSNALFKQTLKHYEAGTLPAKNATKQIELLDVIQQRVQEVATKYGDKPVKVRQMTRSKEIPSLEKAALEATNAVNDPFPIPKKKAAISPAEANTLEEAAQKTVEALDLPPTQKPLTLEEIVTQTPLERKVNIIDYIRTPDRVLNKIGFGREAQFLRNQYEEYVKELPKNIDRITEWVNQVPKESNERLFRYLDGENIKLNPTEMRVAGEIREYLKTWADRLKLPEDNRIASYITHLFDDTLLKKEFDEDLAKIIADRIPGEVYDPFLEKRLGAKGYRKDVWAALDAYTKRATRKVHLDPALQKIKDKAGSSLEFSNLEKSQFEYIQNYINRVNMRPTWIDNMIDTGFKQMFGYKLGQRPVARASQALRRATYRGMLGLNLGSALRNLSQGVNTYAVLGEKYTTIGYAKLFSKSNYDELVREGVLAQNFIEDRSISATKKAIEKLDKTVWVFFDTAEKINRGAAYFGAKSKALADGLNEASAVEYAKRIVRKTQFQYDSVDTPLALSPDILKTFFQFQTYTTKQLEFLGELVKDRNLAALARYAIGGTAFVYTIGQAMGMEIEEILPWYRFDTPPSLKFPVEVFKAATDAPDQYGNPRDTERKIQDVTKAGLGLIPGGIQAKKTYEGMTAVEEGGSYDRAGRQQFEVGGTTGKDIQAILFGKYANDAAKEYFDKKTKTGDEALDKAIKERKQATKNRSVEAKKVYEELKNNAPSSDDRNWKLRQIYETDRELYDKVMALRREEKLNLTDEERAIRYNLGVTDGTRAKYIYEKYKSFENKAEGKAYLKNLRDKKIITDEVMKQLNELRENETQGQ